jgi:ferric-dicitrate binding protein FerR (iron transport regulator)
MNEPLRRSNGITSSRDDVADADDTTSRRLPPRHRNRRLSAGALAIVLALASFVALTRASSHAEPPADEPNLPKPPGIFS